MYEVRNKPEVSINRSHWIWFQLLSGIIRIEKFLLRKIDDNPLIRRISEKGPSENLT